MKKFITTALLTIISGLFFTGCYDAIFQSIRKEVPLEDAEISGYINSIVRYKNVNGDNKEYLLLQNGYIYFKQIENDDGNLTKNETHGEWTRDTSAPEGISYDWFSAEFSGTHFYKLAADQKYVYALGYELVYQSDSGRNVPEKLMLYYTDKIDSGWKEVPNINQRLQNYVDSLAEYYMTNASVQLFCTNSPNPEHRYAYIRIGGANDDLDVEDSVNDHYGDPTTGKCAVIKLDGPDTVIDTPTTDIMNGHGWIPYYMDDTAETKVSTGANLYTKAAVYYNGAVHFSTDLSAITNETRTTDATYVYYGYGDYLRYYSVDNPSSITQCKDVDDTILSIAVTADSLIIGTDGYGAYRYRLDSTGKPYSSTSDFNTNCDDVMYYPYIVRTLLTVDPSITEEGKGSAIYGSLQFEKTASTASASYDNVGLWSYYESRGNWNRE